VLITNRYTSSWQFDSVAISIVRIVVRAVAGPAVVIISRSFAPRNGAVYVIQPMHVDARLYRR
jgi:hypothetical protein